MAKTSKMANGNIVPSSFVKLDVTAGKEGMVLQCGAGDQVYGVAQPGTRYAGWSTIDDGNAAIANEPLDIYCPPEQEVLLRLGGTVTIADFLKSDASGFGVTSSADRDDVGAVALVAGVNNDLVPVQLIIMERSTA